MWYMTVHITIRGFWQSEITNKRSIPDTHMLQTTLSKERTHNRQQHTIETEALNQKHDTKTGKRQKVKEGAGPGL